MKLLIRFFLSPCLVVLVLGMILLNGIIQELRLGVSARKRALVRRYFTQVFHPLCRLTETFVRFGQH